MSEVAFISTEKFHRFSDYLFRCVVNNPLDLFAWKVRSERKRRHLTQKQLAERLGMNPRTIIDLETCQSNPKFETVVLVAKELNISVDAAIFPEMVNQTVSKTGGSLPERRVTRSGSMCPAALLFHPFAMRAVYSSFVL